MCGNLGAPRVLNSSKRVLGANEAFSSWYRAMQHWSKIERVVAAFSIMLGTFLLVVAAESVTSTPFVGSNELRASHQLFLGGASPPPHSLCMSTGVDASDNYCDSPGSELPMCAYGADCVDCAPLMPRLPPQPPVSSPPSTIASTPPAPPALCINTVTRIGMPADASEGCCDDGGPGAEYPDGQYGTDGADCADCANRCPMHPFLF